MGVGADRGGQAAMVNVEILYFDGCPNHQALLAHMHDLLQREGISAQVSLRHVSDDNAAQRERFLGSPSVRVNGRDVDPGADRRTDFGMKCRLYQTADGLAGMPPDEWLLQAFGAPRANADHKSGAAVEGIRAWAAQRAEGLSTVERELHRRILRTFATGRIPDRSHLRRWASELGLDPDRANASLAGNDLVHLDARAGGVAVAYPFSGTPTRHRVRLASGTQVCAMCAIDALGIGFMLGEPTTVVSTDAGSGEPIEISLPRGGPASWSPPQAVVMAGCAGGGPSLGCTCPHTNFAASPEDAHDLLAADKAVAGEVLSMPEAIARGREFFGGLLEDAMRRPA
jgi:Alkylmercury lyase